MSRSTREEPDGRRGVGFVAAAVVVALVSLTACNTEEAAERASTVRKGGIYRVAYQEPFGFTDGFDPSGEYLATAFGIYSNLLVRTLVGFKHVAGPEGNVVIPDLATEVPEPTNNGKTYTFELKSGIKFGPPLSREITSEDVVYAMERIANPKVAAQYGFYFTPLIEGMQEYAEGKAKTISGIETPDEKTIVFHLNERAGDFIYRMTMSAAGPIPPEIGKCFEDAGEYGRYVWSSGPYMIEGQDQTDISSCNTIKPFSGFDPNKHMILVRNPDYDPDTDDPEARESLPDEFHFLLNSNVKDIYAKVARSEYEDEVASEPPQILRKFSTDPELKDLLKTEQGDATWYINFDLTQPPFDDIHVRKAANLVMDKDALRRAWGGPISGEVATHITPPIVTAGHPTAEEYDPYPSEGFRGDVEAAKEEMAQSEYDADGDGVCDDPVCDGVLHFTRNQSPWTDMVPIMEEAFEQIGITLATRELSDFYTPWQTPAKTAPISSGAGWGKDYADALTFVAALFSSDSIAQTGSTNVPLVGLTPDIAQRIGIAELPGRTIQGIPSIDSEVEECTNLTGQSRIDCWVELDKKLMEDVVPWIPFLWSNLSTVIAPDVSQWEFDQASGYQAWAHVAVDQTKQRGL